MLLLGVLDITVRFGSGFDPPELHAVIDKVIVIIITIKKLERSLKQSNCAICFIKLFMLCSLKPLYYNNPYYFKYYNKLQYSPIYDQSKIIASSLRGVVSYVVLLTRY